MATTHEQTIDIKNLSTKTVTFFPQKAEIAREIPNVKLKPGFNEISIIGITPIADESSIKVEAHGSTTVTDMVVELINNPDDFEDVYPMDSDSNTEDDLDNEELAKPKEIKDLESEIRKLSIDRDAHAEVINNNTQSLQILENLIDKLELKESEVIESSLSTYQKRRADFYAALAGAKEKKIHVDTRIAELEKQKQKLDTKHTMKQFKLNMKNKKAQQKKRRILAKQRESKNRDTVEKAKFWPKKVYQIKVTIESSVITPGTSRRGSFESLATAKTMSADDNQSEPTSTSLLLTYIVNGASWTPKYDLSISTTSSTAVMNYRAEIENTTSETWRDSKIMLSTSRATFSGVSEPIPVIKPWMLFLVKPGTFGSGSTNPTWSHQERDTASIIHYKTIEKTSEARRDDLFGVPAHLLNQDRNYDRLASQVRAQVAMNARNAAVLESRSGGGFGAAAPSGGLFGSSQSQMMPQTQAAMPQMQMMQAAARSVAAPPPPPGAVSAPAAAAPTGGSSSFKFGSPFAAKPSADTSRARRSEMSKDEEVQHYSLDDEDNNGPPTPPEDAGWEESGLTTTLELRGSRTIAPSSSARRFKIATLRLNQIQLTHIIVPKLRAEAFLRARIVNSSPTSILKGSAGLTLDGTFLGHTTIPRCSAGENFPLPLGVDPAISVSYPTPVSRKNLSAGMFNKEHSTTFTRVVVLTNTRTGGAAVTLTVKDQVPVSEDERLKIDIIVPKGLSDEGDRAKAGVEYQSAQTAKIGQAGSSSGSSERDRSGSTSKGSSSSSGWGQAIARLHKFGSVEWTVTLNPSKAVKLTLEYTIRFPGTDRVAESFSGNHGSFSPS